VDVYITYYIIAFTPRVTAVMPAEGTDLPSGSHCFRTARTACIMLLHYLHYMYRICGGILLQRACVRFVVLRRARGPLGGNHLLNGADAAMRAYRPYYYYTHMRYIFNARTNRIRFPTVSNGMKRK